MLPLWKSFHSLNLMLPKEDRAAMLLRLFNDTTPLVNNGLQMQKEREEKRRLEAAGTPAESAEGEAEVAAEGEAKAAEGGDAKAEADVEMEEGNSDGGVPVAAQPAANGDSTAQ